MKTPMRIAILGATVLAAGIGVHAVTAFAQSGPAFMQHMGPGNPAGSAMAHDAATMAQLGAIHDLFLNHDKITRTVVNLPDGIRTITESDDPRIAELLKGHVAEMGERVAVGDDPGLPIESDALHSLFRDYANIETTTEITEKGVVVIQTSTNPETVAALQQHASEVTDFVEQGMVALQTAMMKNMGGPMHHMGAMMMGGMMQHGMGAMGGMSHGGSMDAH